MAKWKAIKLRAEFKSSPSTLYIKSLQINSEKKKGTPLKEPILVLFNP